MKTIIRYDVYVDGKLVRSCFSEEQLVEAVKNYHGFDIKEQILHIL